MNTRTHPPDGVFVLGATGSGGPQVESLLRRSGLRSVEDGLADAEAGRRQALDGYNAYLLSKVPVDLDGVPTVPPSELARYLATHLDEARRAFEKSCGPPNTAAHGLAPWVWTDSAHCLLASFWVAALGIEPAVVLVHQPPDEAANVLGTARGVSAEAGLQLWDHYSRAALWFSDQWGGLVVGTETMAEAPTDVLARISTYLESCGMAPPAEPIEEYEAARLLRCSRTSVEPSTPVMAHHRVLSNVFRQLERRGVASVPDAAIVHELSKFYDAEYFESHCNKDQVPYRRDERQWITFFGSIADRIVAEVNPESVLDVGCAIGLLVESLRDRDVDARGMDISPWAIDQVPTGLRPYCFVGSITEELEGHFDLVTCIEVLEHLPPSMAEGSIENLCRHTNAVLFSSSPDFDEPTHLNVQPVGYWAELFARQGFWRDFEHDASFISPAAVLFRRKGVTATDEIRGYEHAIWKAHKQTQGVLVTHGDLLKTLDEAVEARDELGRQHAQVLQQRDALSLALSDLKLRRQAEAVAGLDHVHAQEVSQKELMQKLAAIDLAHARAIAEIETIKRTKTFRYTEIFRRLYGRVRRVGRASAQPQVTEDPPVVPNGSYGSWVAMYDTLTDADRVNLGRQVDRLQNAPLVSVIMPVYNTPEPFLRAAIESVRRQIYQRWELCIADDCSSAPWVAAVLREYEEMDSRIKVVRRSENGHISAASNSALELAIGSWVLCLDHDDELSAHAMALAVITLEAHPDAGLLYSDEDKIDVDGCRHSAYFKPDFDPLLFLGQNYLAHLCMLRRDLVERVGGYRIGLEGSQDWDLALRVSELLSTDQVLHVPHVLYHWRVHPDSTASGLDAKPYAAAAARRAVDDHLRRKGLAGEVVPIPMAGWNRVKWKLPDEPPLVSVIIPTRDGMLLSRCVDSVRFLTTYANYEIVVVDNGSMGMGPLQYLRDHEGALKVMRDEREFNYSALNNAAVARSSGEIVCLLNDDTEVISPGWLEELVSQVLQPGVGAAGAKLYFSDGRVQHGGVLLGVGGLATHAHRLCDRLSPGYFGRLILPQHFSAVTAACMVVRRNAWEQVGGLDEEHLPVAFNDVDFCLRLGEAGWGVVWTPSAELFHHESVSRGSELDAWDRHVSEVRYMKERWWHLLQSDPAYNPNLSICGEGFELAWPPRATYRPLRSASPDNRTTGSAQTASPAGIAPTAHEAEGSDPRL